MTDKEKLIKRLRGLKQNKNLSDSEIEQLVNRRLEEEELRSSFVGLKDEEINKAIITYHKYVEEGSFQSLAEKSTLIGMLYKEALVDRMKEFIRKEGDAKDGAIPLSMAEKMMDMSAQVLSDKEKLGMLKDKDVDTFSSAWNELKEKANAYYNEHAGEIYYQCPYCNEFSRQIMQIDGYDIAKASFFKHTTLYNKVLFQLYHEKKITIEEMANVLDVHTKYITFIYEGLFLKELKNATKN